MAGIGMITSLLIASAVLLVGVSAEKHTVSFANKCGFGTPVLLAGGKILSQGKPVTITGPLHSAVAFLQTGKCGGNGEHCTLIETTLINPTGPGSGSFTDISLISPHAFSVTSGFKYSGGCDGAGADCTSNGCLTAFHHPDDTDVQVGNGSRYSLGQLGHHFLQLGAAHTRSQNGGSRANLFGMRHV